MILVRKPLDHRRETIMPHVRNQASPDYENPEQNVADIPEPVILSTNKARQGVLVAGMWVVLVTSTVLAIAGLAAAYFF
jgi:hypothetical protein